MTSKKELREKENLERLSNAIATLDSISRNNNIQRNIRNMIREVMSAVKNEKNGSVSVTQNPQMQSHIRTMVWQVVSTLESIRE
jgi:hypothetical protein